MITVGLDQGDPFSQIGLAATLQLGESRHAIFHAQRDAGVGRPVTGCFRFLDDLTLAVPHDATENTRPLAKEMLAAVRLRRNMTECMIHTPPEVAPPGMVAWYRRWDCLPRDPEESKFGSQIMFRVCGKPRVKLGRGMVRGCPCGLASSFRGDDRDATPPGMVAWYRRWSSVLMCAAAKAFATFLLEKRGDPGAGGRLPSIQEVLGDARREGVSGC